MYQSITERYITASNATSLVVDTDSIRGNVDVLIAAGWSKSSMGKSLLRLVSEFDAAEKRRGGMRQILADAKTGGAKNLLGQLRSLEPSILGVEIHARNCGIESPLEKSIAVVLHCLDATCMACNGQKFRRIPNTPALSERACTCCRGRGVVSIPFADDGRMLAAYIQDCMNSAKESYKKRLHRV